MSIELTSDRKDYEQEQRTRTHDKERKEGEERDAVPIERKTKDRSTSLRYT